MKHLLIALSCLTAFGAGFVAQPVHGYLASAQVFQQEGADEDRDVQSQKKNGICHSAAARPSPATASDALPAGTAGPEGGESRGAGSIRGV